MNARQAAEYRASIARMKANAAHQRLIEAARKRPNPLQTVAARTRWRCYRRDTQLRR